MLNCFGPRNPFLTCPLRFISLRMQIERAELAKRIRARELPAVLLCYGEETLFHQEILTALRASYGGEGSWGYEVTDAASLDPAKLMASAGTLSFGGGTKVTVVRSAHRLRKDQLTALERIAAHRGVECAVVLMAEKELKANEEPLKWAREQNAWLCRLVSPKPKEIGAWLASQAAARGFSLDAETAAFMIDLAAGNLMALSQMLAKLDLYRGKTKRILRADVEDLLHDSFEKSVYDCVRAVFAVGGKNAAVARERAAAELHRVLRFDATEGILRLSRALSREAFALLKYHEMRKKGATNEMLAKELKLGARKWLLEREYPARAGRWPMERLRRLLMRLADVDLAVRTTGRDAEAMLEQVVIGNLAPTSVEETDEVFV